MIYKRLLCMTAISSLFILTLYLYSAQTADPPKLAVGYLSLSDGKTDLAAQNAAKCGLRGVQLMAERAAQGGMLGGRSVEIVPLNLSEDAGWQKTVLEAARDKPLAALFISSDIDEFDALCAPLRALDCPIFTASEWTVLPDEGGVFRAVCSRQAMMQALARYAEAQHYRTVAVIAADQPAIRRQAADFVRFLPSETVRADLRFYADIPEQNVLDSRHVPDAFAVWGETDFLVRTVRLIRRAGYLGPVLGGSSLGDPAVLNAIGIASNNIVFAAPYRVPRSTEEIESEALAELTDQYTQRFGEYPESPALFSAYDQMLLFSTACRLQGGFSTLPMLEAVSSIQNCKGMAGVFDYTAHTGEGIAVPRIYIAEGGVPIPAV